MEKYTFEGVTYNVAPNRLEEFLQKYPNAVKYEEPGKTTDSSIETQTTESNVMDSGSKSGLLESPEDTSFKGFLEDLYTSYKQGKGAGSTVNEAFDVYKKGASISDEELQGYIDAANAMDAIGQTNEQVEFQKTSKEAGGGILVL